MFKLALGALIGAIIATLLPNRKFRLIWLAVLFALFVIIEVIFIAHGGD